MLHTFRWPKPLSLLVRVLIVAAAVFTVAAAAAVLVDRVNPPATIVDPGIASVDTTKHSRLLILHVDSWRYETALDSSLMPQVARLRKNAATWQLETVFEGFTIPAVRAAFSGRDETQLVSLIQNFSFHALRIGSFYLDASRLGKHTLVVAHDPWVQFGPYFDERLPPDNGQDRITLDHLRPAIALNAFRNEKYDVVVCHYESADWVAHETGIHSDRYRHEFAYADSLIAAFAAARHPNDYLLVYGDHGHSETGEHKTGIAIPTYGMLFGPDVKPGVASSALAMTNLRYIASYALGINLRSAPYDKRTISQFLPIAADTVVALTDAERRMSHAVGDYALAAVVAFGALLLGFWLVKLVDGDNVAVVTVVAASAAFLIELVLQQELAPSVSLFPLLLVALGIAATREHFLVRLLIVATGVWFVTRLLGADLRGSGLVATPTGFVALVPLYAGAIAAKLLLLRAPNIRPALPNDRGVSTHIANTDTNLQALQPRSLWRNAIIWTTLLALLEFRVWDHPAACGAVLLAGIFAFFNSTNVDNRRMANIVILQALVYFTLRLPLYQLAWIDLFFGALWLIARNRNDTWVDALIVTGTFALTCGWLASSLEWGFLYTIIPADIVEKHVVYFVPFILAKIPLLLVLSFVIMNRTPAKRMVTLVFVYTALRFAAAWLLRLSGASGANLWPLAEQGMYLATFVVAVAGWGWHTSANAFTRSQSAYNT